MRNQIRADFYKLWHSRQVWITFFTVLALFLLFTLMSFGDGTFSMGVADKYVEGIPVIQGFVGFTYENPDHPQFRELAYSAVSFVGILWIVLLSLAVQFYSKEYSTGAIKLSVAYGISSFTVFFSKFIVVISYFALLFYSFIYMAFILCAMQTGISLQLEHFLSLFKLVSLFYLVLIVFTMLCLTVQTLMRNTAAVTTLMIVFMFSMVILLIANYEKELPLYLKVYLAVNPMHYLWQAGGYWADSTILRDILLYFGIGLPALTGGSWLILRRQEIK